MYYTIHALYTRAINPHYTHTHTNNTHTVKQYRQYNLVPLPYPLVGMYGRTWVMQYCGTTGMTFNQSDGYSHLGISSNSRKQENNNNNNKRKTMSVAPTHKTLLVLLLHKAHRVVNREVNRVVNRVVDHVHLSLANLLV